MDSKKIDYLVRHLEEALQENNISDANYCFNELKSIEGFDINPFVDRVNELNKNNSIKSAQENKSAIDEVKQKAIEIKTRYVVNSRIEAFGLIGGFGLFFFGAALVIIGGSTFVDFLMNIGLVITIAGGIGIAIGTVFVFIANSAYDKYKKYIKTVFKCISENEEKFKYIENVGTIADEYIGQMDSGIPNGFGIGIAKYSNYIYIGEWKDGKKVGIGKMISDDMKMTIEGEFSDDSLNGIVDIIWDNGDEWHGEYKNNRPFNGKGKTEVKLRVKEGVWNYGKFTKQTIHNGSSEWNIVDSEKKQEIREKNEKEKAELERIAEEKRIEKKKKKKRAVVVLISLIATVILVLGAIFSINAMSRENKYKSAVEMLNSGSFIEAGKMFATLGDYKDSYEQIKESKYLLAQQYTDSKEFNKAIDIYKELGDYKESKSNATKCIYLMATNYFDEKEYEKAIETYEHIGNYKDSLEKIKESKYLLANKYYKDKSYEKANELYISLKDYKDSKKKANETGYTIATSYMNTKDYDNANKKFLSLGNYKDSQSKANLCLKNSKKQKLLNANIKDVVEFGKYKWIVAKKINSKVMLVMTESCDEKPYNKEFERVTWKSCTLRTWLNDDFYNSAFDSTEQSLIQTTSVETVGGYDEYEDQTYNNVVTNDKIFLLSKKEFEECSSIINYLYNDSYWLRSSGPSYYASLVGYGQEVYDDGEMVEYNEGVRPALWLNLE